MRIAFISDVHAIRPALRAVLADINAAAPDAVVSCGDLAAGPLPHPTIDLLRGLDIPVYCVRGNADRGTFAAAVGLCVLMTIVGSLMPVMRAVRVAPASVFRGE